MLDKRQALLRKDVGSACSAPHMLCCSSTDLQTQSTVHDVGPLCGWQQVLLRKVAGWLKPGGQVFIHIFCHKTVPYHFEVRAVPCWVGLFYLTVCPETAEI